MIKLLIEDYCQDCKGFEAQVATNVVYGENGRDQVMTQITCARREMCAKLVRRYSRADATGAETPEGARLREFLI